MNEQTLQSRSKKIVSSQTQPHRNLSRQLSRYEQSNYLNSIPNYARAEFSRVEAFVRQDNAAIILDSGCGVGESAFKLARLFPYNTVIAVDKSADRLRRATAQIAAPENLIFVRCDLIHFWRLLHQAQWQVSQHYLFYPNPWPKVGQLKRRWHAHPIFPTIIKLGGVLTMRTNWKVYADEFALALQLYLRVPVPVQRLVIEEPLTAFERKYVQSGHTLYEVKVNLASV